MKRKSPLEETIEWLHQYPSVYFYGIAGLGKTVFAKKLAERWQANGEKCTYVEIPRDAESKYQIEMPEWIGEQPGSLLILDQFENIRDTALGSRIMELLERSQGKPSVLYVSRKPAPEQVHSRLWEKKMKELTGDFLLMNRKEFSAMVLKRKLSLGQKDMEALYHYSGGVRGILQICLYLLEERYGGEINQAFLGHPMLMAYIEENIWKELTGAQQEICSHTVYIPVLDRCLSAVSGQYALEELERMGLARCGQGKIYEFPGFLGHLTEHLGTAPEGPELLAEAAGDLYRAQGCVREALACYLYSQNREKHRACLYQYYRQAFCDVENRVMKQHMEFSMKEEKENEALFLWGMLYLGLGEQERARTMLSRLEGRLQTAVTSQPLAELYLNLLWHTPEASVVRWMDRAHGITAVTGPIRIYSFHNSEPESLCAVKDFSEVLRGRKKEIQEYRCNWREIVTEDQWYCFTLAEAEYMMETNRLEEALELADSLLIIEEGMETEKTAALFGLLCGLRLRGLSLGRGMEELSEQYYKILIRDGGRFMIQNVSALKLICLVWQKDSTGAVYRLSEEHTENYRPIDSQNSFFYLQRARNYMLNRCYERALPLYERLSAHFTVCRQYCMQAECLMGQAVCLSVLGEGTAALKQISMAMSLGEHYRYVGLFSLFGEAGRSLLEEHISISEGWKAEGERIHTNKRSYYYGNVVGTSYENYINVLYRAVRRNAGKYPIMQNTGDSPRDHLTITEKSILIYIEKGFSNGEIAEKMNISLNTVKKHIYNIYKKLDVNSRVQAIQKGKMLGVLPL